MSNQSLWKTQEDDDSIGSSIQANYQANSFRKVDKSPKKKTYPAFRKVEHQSVAYNPSLSNAHQTHNVDAYYKEQEKYYKIEGGGGLMGKEERFRERQSSPRKPAEYPCLVTDKVFGRERHLNPFAKAKLYTRPIDRSLEVYAKYKETTALAPIGPGTYDIADLWELKPVCGAVKPMAVMESTSKRELFEYLGVRDQRKEGVSPPDHRYTPISKMRPLIIPEKPLPPAVKPTDTFTTLATLKLPKDPEEASKVVAYEESRRSECLNQSSTVSTCTSGEETGGSRSRVSTAGAFSFGRSESMLETTGKTIRHDVTYKRIITTDGNSYVVALAPSRVGSGFAREPKLAEPWFDPNPKRENDARLRLFTSNSVFGESRTSDFPTSQSGPAVDLENHRSPVVFPKSVPVSTYRDREWRPPMTASTSKMLNQTPEVPLSRSLDAKARRMLAKSGAVSMKLAESMPMSSGSSRAEKTSDSLGAVSSAINDSAMMEEALSRSTALLTQMSFV